MTNSDTKRHDVVVVGGGQAGLAIGYFLARQGRDFTILEAAREPAAAWRASGGTRSSCSPRRATTRLPGLTSPAIPIGYPGRDDVVAYLTDYARHFDLPVELDSRVRSIRKTDGTYLVELDDRTLRGRPGRRRHRARSRCRSCRRSPSASVRMSSQLHSTAYRSPEAIPDGPRARGRRRQHRLPDRRGAIALARGPSVDRLAPDAAASAHPRPRPVLVSRRDGPDPQDDRVADRPADGGARHADRLEPRGRCAVGTASSCTAARVDAAGSTVTLRRRDTARRPRGDLGDRLPRRSLVDRRPGRSTRAAPRRTERGVTDVARPLLPRPDLAAHERLGAARLGQGRRRVPRATDQRLPTRPRAEAARRRSASHHGERHEHTPDTSRPTSTGFPSAGRPSWSSWPTATSSTCASRRSPSGSATRRCGCWPTTARSPARR